jgi:hypothetical protein
MTMSSVAVIELCRGGTPIWRSVHGSMACAGHAATRPWIPRWQSRMHTAEAASTSSERHPQ